MAAEMSPSNLELPKELVAVRSRINGHRYCQPVWSLLHTPMAMVLSCSGKLGTVPSPQIMAMERVAEADGKWKPHCREG